MSSNLSSAMHVDKLLADPVTNAKDNIEGSKGIGGKGGKYKEVAREPIEKSSVSASTTSWRKREFGLGSS